VHTYTVVWRPPQPVFEAPYIPIVVELDEGWHMISNLIQCDPADVHVDMPVEAAFVPQAGGITLPMFVPVKAAEVPAT
jgi:uncharacterized OB-fold protein